MNVCPHSVTDGYVVSVAAIVTVPELLDNDTLLPALRFSAVVLSPNIYVPFTYIGLCVFVSLVGGVYPNAVVTSAFVKANENVVPLKLSPVPALYVVFGGTAQVASSLRYFVVPEVVLGFGTSPLAAVVPDGLKF